MAWNTCFSVPVKPNKVKIVTPNQLMSIHKSQNVKCETSGSYPPAKLTWLLDGKPIRNAVVTVREFTLTLLLIASLRCIRIGFAGSCNKYVTSIIVLGILRKLTRCRISTTKQRCFPYRCKICAWQLELQNCTFKFWNIFSELSKHCLFSFQQTYK